MDNNKETHRRLLAIRADETSFLKEVPERVIALFTDGLKFNLDSGQLAHADYGMMKEHLDKEAILLLFSQLGVDQHEFNLGSDRVCLGNHCVHAANQYCSSSECH